MEPLNSLFFIMKSELIWKIFCDHKSPELRLFLCKRPVIGRNVMTFSEYAAEQGKVKIRFH